MNPTRADQSRQRATRDQRSSVDPQEVARFDAMARDWWDPKGPMAVLHQFNPVRVAYIRDMACRHFGRDACAANPLAGLDLVDVGCGGGVLSEPMARLGAAVTGLDPAAENIAVATARATKVGNPAAFRNDTIEAVVAEGRRFDIVLAMEVVEHVADVDGFVTTCCQAVKPDGMLVMATLNRTLRSYAMAIVGAEYVLRWLPRGTHDWQKFVTPDELSSAIEAGGLQVTDEAGVVFNPLSGNWSLSRDTAVNYMLSAVRT